MRLQDDVARRDDARKNRPGAVDVARRFEDALVVSDESDGGS